MPGITIIGLGPGNPDQITLEAWRALEDAQEVYLRTLRHPVVEALPRGPAYRSFDALYEAMDTFPEVYEAIAQRLLTLAERPEGVIYAVPGHPSMGETSVRRVLAMAAERALPVRIVAGLSFLEPATIALGIDPFDGLQIADAPPCATSSPQPRSRRGRAGGAGLQPPVGIRVKLTLMNLYRYHPIRLVRAAAR